MKIKWLYTVAIFFSFLSSGFAQKKTETLIIKTQINCDHCKQCESCGTRLENALYDKKGIKRVDIDDKEMNIKVVFNTQKINADEIRETIAAHGYDADDIKAKPEALALLDECCKGGE